MLNLNLLGTGGATPYLSRTTPMMAFQADKKTFLIDCGSGATQRLSQAKIKAKDVDGLLFTHFHADHCVDFPVFILTTYLEERKTPLSVYGPQGTIAFVNKMLDDLFPYIKNLIKNVTGNDFIIEVKEVIENQSIDLNGLKIIVGKAIHSVPTVSYRINTPDGSFTYSGDTEYCEELGELAKNTDVLIHECPFPVTWGELPDHTSARKLGLLAKRANAKNLILTHLFEDIVGNETDMIRAVNLNYSGNVYLGEDLMEIQINDGNTAIK